MNRRVFASNAIVCLAALGTAPAVLAQKKRKVKPPRPLTTGGLYVPPGTTYEILGTLEVDANVIVEGTLVMRPGATLRFVDVDEARFVGGGMNPIDSDIGLWVVGDGMLDVQGTPRAGWNNTGWDATWQGGDELVLTPTAPRDYSGFQSFALGGAVPRVNGRWDAEVLNLSRDVVIEGTSGGRAHVFVRSTRPQTIKHCLIRHMGPRRRTGPLTTAVPGRYGLHFHHNHDGSRGTTVEGVVVRDCGNHSFVPHLSHGITLRDCIAYDVYEDAYWWDVGDETSDVTIEHCLAALVKSDPVFRGFRLSGFTLGIGERNVVRDCVAVGIQGNSAASGFQWPEGGSGSWDFAGNLAHNNRRNGISVWQNNADTHLIEDFVAYRCGGFGVSQGAYLTPDYHYEGLDLFENEEGGIVLHSQHGSLAPTRTDGYGLSFENVVITGGLNGVVHDRHARATSLPTLLKNITFERQIGHKVRVFESRDGGDVPGLHDYVYCALDPQDVQILGTPAGFRLRAQNVAGGPAWSMDRQGTVVTVPAFYTQ